MACSRCGAKNLVTLNQMIATVNSSLPYLKFMHCAYKDQFESIFKGYGIDVTEAKLPLLAQAFESGGDLRGDVKRPDGTVIRFSVQKALDSIDTSKPVNNSCAI